MKYSKLALALLVVPSAFAMIEMVNATEAHAEENAIDWIQKNWLNYPDATGKWHVATVNGKTALGTTQNVQWTGYLNTHALQTTDAIFEFKMNQNTTSDDDNMGWTFRHTYTGDGKDIKKHAFYTFVSDGGGAIPSGIYKKKFGSVPEFSGKSFIPLQKFNHIRKTKTEYSVKIDVKDEAGGTRIKAWIDGQLVADVLDVDPLESGGYGPFSYSQTNAYYYDINVNGASFLNVPPTTTISTSVTNGEKKRPGDIIHVSGSSYDNDKVGADDIKTYYKFDKGEEVLIPTTIDDKGRYIFDTNIKIPTNLEPGEHTLYIYSKDGDNGESKKEEIKFFTSEKYEHMVKVIGTFEATTLDVRVPALTTFLYNPNNATMTAQRMNLENNSNAPVYMKMKEINVSKDSTWKPSLVAPNQYDVKGWNNLTKDQTQAEVALGLKALEGNSWLKGIEQSTLWSSDLNSTNRVGVIKTKSNIETEPVLKAGTSLTTEQILTTNYVFEFGLE